jgi:hypothetical protein
LGSWAASSAEMSIRPHAAGRWPQMQRLASKHHGLLDQGPTMHPCLPHPGVVPQPQHPVAHSAPRTPRLASLQRGRGSPAGRETDRDRDAGDLTVDTACSLVCLSHCTRFCFCELSTLKSVRSGRSGASASALVLTTDAAAQLLVRCTRDALHWSLSSKSVCMCVCVCVYCAVGSNQQWDVDGWLSSPEHEDAWMWMASRRQGRHHCSAADNARVCALGAGALPHTRCSSVVCVSIAFMYLNYVCCRYVWCARHTHTCFQWPTPPPRSGGVHVAGVAGPCAASLLQCSWVPTTRKFLHCFVEAYQSWVCNDAF